MGVPDVFTGVSSGGLTVKETDGAPTVANVNTINVSNGSLTDDGGGVVTISTGGGGGSGTVTSVAVSGGTTGLTTSGGPITTSGTITVAGTLVVANGGTGATTASSARTNLEIFSGRFTQSVLAAPDPGIASITVTDSNVTATNTIVYSIENPNSLILPAGTGTITARSAATSFTITLDALNPTPGNLDMFVNYTIIG
jgi:hypothetical protein